MFMRYKDRISIYGSDRIDTYDPTGVVGQLTVFINLGGDVVVLFWVFQ